MRAVLRLCSQIAKKRFLLVLALVVSLKQGKEFDGERLWVKGAAYQNFAHDFVQDVEKCTLGTAHNVYATDAISDELHQRYPRRVHLLVCMSRNLSVAGQTCGRLSKRKDGGSILSKIIISMICKLNGLGGSTNPKNWGPGSVHDECTERSVCAEDLT